MQVAKDQITYFFVDESGDTTFYNRHRESIVGQSGCSKILMLGFIKTKDPQAIRSELTVLRKHLINCPELAGTDQVKRIKIAFHAKDDCPFVRQAVFKKLQQLDFTAQFVVARKTKGILNKFNGKPNDLYDHLISQLFKNVLHKSTENIIYFATRGNRKRQDPLNRAIENAISMFESKWNTKVDTARYVYPQKPSGETCLQVVDYINWAIQRAYTKREMDFFELVRDKVRLLVDINDFKEKWGNFYTSRNPFHIDKTSPL